MATADNPPEGAPPVPSTYPNPLANNVNMHPIPWKGYDITSGDHVFVPEAPQDGEIRISGAGGSAYEDMSWD